MVQGPEELVDELMWAIQTLKLVKMDELDVEKSNSKQYDKQEAFADDNSDCLINASSLRFLRPRTHELLFSREPLPHASEEVGDLWLSPGGSPVPPCVLLFLNTEFLIAIDQAVPFPKVDAACKLPVWCRHLAFHRCSHESGLSPDQNVSTSGPIGNATGTACENLVPDTQQISTSIH
jgi:hypothetical protein